MKHHRSVTRAKSLDWDMDSSGGMLSTILGFALSVLNMIFSYKGTGTES